MSHARRHAVIRALALLWAVLVIGLGLLILILASGGALA